MELLAILDDYSFEMITIDLTF